MALTDVCGFIVAGGRSARMGRDKALLPLGDGTLLRDAIGRARAITDDVRILCGPQPRYEDFGVPVVVDPVCGAGPIAGLYAALTVASAEGRGALFWLGVDLPRVTPAFIAAQLEALREADAVLALTDRGIEPLCAAFRVEPALGAVRAALLGGRLKLTSALDGLRVVSLDADGAMFANVNTPDDYDRLRD